jgi:hypothetical protein
MAHVQRIAIGLGKDRNGAHAELATRTVDAQRDLSSVCN